MSENTVAPVLRLAPPPPQRRSGVLVVPTVTALAAFLAGMLAEWFRPEGTLWQRTRQLGMAHSLALRDATCVCWASDGEVY